MAVSMGVERTKANFLVSIYAIANVIGHFCCGWLSDKSCVSCLSVYNTSVFLSGITIFFMPFCHSYILYVSVISIYGFFNGFVTLEAIVLVELFGLDNLTSSLGVMYLLQGIGSIIGAPMVGAIYIAVGSFDIGFYIAGAIFVAASLCSFAAQVIHRRKNCKWRITQSVVQ